MRGLLASAVFVAGAETSLAQSAPNPGDLVITEIMSDPSAVSDTSGEWFEIRNVTAGTIILDGLRIEDDGGAGFTIPVDGPDGAVTVGPGAAFVLGRNADPAVNGGVNLDYVYSGFSLTNTSDEIVILLDDVLIDRVAYDNGATFPDPSGASMSLDPDVIDAAANDFGFNWCEATVPYGAGDFGSPGLDNEQCPGGDADGDGVDDELDNCPALFNPDQTDCDADGVGDACAIVDGLVQDCNGNGIPDACDITAGASADDNGNGLPDECEVTPPANLVINEVRTNAAGNPYFELRGDPGTSLTGLRYVVIGDGTAAQGSGVIEAVIALDGHQIPADGLMLAAEDDFTLASIVFDVDLLLSSAAGTLNFEADDNVTHMLVANFHGFVGQDLDMLDDGVLDTQPWSDLLDAVALIREANPPSGTEFHYAAQTVGPLDGTAPAHAYRCGRAGNGEPTEATWIAGATDPFAADAVDSPGEANPECASAPPCLADIAGPTGPGDGFIDALDLLTMLSQWGCASCGAEGAPCSGDLTGPDPLVPDGCVDALDLALLTSQWTADANCAGP